jgi:hypothetical protein
MRGLKFHPSDEDLSPGTPINPRLPPNRVYSQHFCLGTGLSGGLPGADSPVTIP